MALTKATGDFRKPTVGPGKVVRCESLHVAQNAWLTIRFNVSKFQLSCNDWFFFVDVSPHLVFKNGMTPTLWPQDMPFPPDEGKEEVQSTFGDDATQQGGDRNCFSPNSMQYPAYFKDSKGERKL